MNVNGLYLTAAWRVLVVGLLAALVGELAVTNWRFGEAARQDRLYKNFVDPILLALPDGDKEIQQRLDKLHEDLHDLEVLEAGKR